jgi:hypothetical protein
MTGDHDALAARVAAERAAQGLPPTVEDEGVLLQVAAILLAEAPEREVGSREP